MLLAGACMSLWGAPALAQDAISMNIVRYGQIDGPQPALELVASEAMHYTVSVKCGRASDTRSGDLVSGDRVSITLATGPGRHACTGQLGITLSDGSEGEMPLSFNVEVLQPLGVAVPRGHVDLAGGKMRVLADRPLAEVEVELFGEDGPLGGGIARPGGKAPGAPVQVTWSPLSDNSDVFRVHVKATDTHGFWGGVDLFPWYYEVPHDDLVFASGQAAIDKAETPKLVDAYGRIQEVVDRYGKIATVNLYVAGHTDTVGSAATNATLSEARAKAIATWFKAQGFQGAILYQGFGEKGLAVSTPDETDELQNRRATYVVAAEEPPVSTAMPGSNWKPLR